METLKFSKIFEIEVEIGKLVEITGDMCAKVSTLKIQAYNPTIYFFGVISGFQYFLKLLLHDRVSQVNTDQLTERGNQYYGNPEIFKNL